MGTVSEPDPTGGCGFSGWIVPVCFVVEPGLRPVGFGRVLRNAPRVSASSVGVCAAVRAPRKRLMITRRRRSIDCMHLLHQGLGSIVIMMSVRIAPVNFRFAG